MKITVLDDTRCHLGEGPVWDEAEQALYWVDSLGPTIYRHDWATRTTARWVPPGESIGSLTLRAGDGLILAMDNGLHRFDLSTGASTAIAEPLAPIEEAHFNDGKVDRAGNFVAGGVHGNEGVLDPQPVCPMVRLNADHEIPTVMEQFLCFNGPCFSPDGATLYVNGRGNMQNIEALPYDSETGIVDEAAGCILIDGINPDGTTVDAEGTLWSAQWDDHCVLGISTARGMNGDITGRIELTGQVVSSVMFGGPDLDIMFVTTLGKPHWGTTPEAKDAGAVFMIEGTGLKGIAEKRFAG
ncbi:MAG: SMP-30/gluconolactonase/LRE family protein [Rhodospirillales bacterium]|nr:SMP-30/gluconolactonase/LRE family protein [Rhodospirillales bacterium]